MPTIQHPYYPIIYLRGYAMTQGEIEDTVATPYMGFNLGSTKARQEWDRSISMHIFESPLVRLMKDYRYHDCYRDGRMAEGSLPARSVIVYRYYDQASRDLGVDRTPSVMEAAQGLSGLILRVREQVCGTDRQALEEFRVYLVAHSMGGLVCRCFLQNDAVGAVKAKRMVDKVFTYGTPHNGIELRGLKAPSWFGLWDADNFSHRKMKEYLALDADSARVDSLNGRFPPHKFFCLIGTDHQDYMAARLAVGPMSDGLVKIENAAVQGAPRAFVYRSHSGHFGLVNSEEGYQNLQRFLFGDTFVTGSMEVDRLPLPPRIDEIHRRRKKDKLRVRVSYLFEATVTPRGSFDINLSERRADEFSAIFRSYDALLNPAAERLPSPRSPVLFSVYLSRKLIPEHAAMHTDLKKSTMVFSLRLGVRSTDYQVLKGSRVILRQEAEVLFADVVTIQARRTRDGWDLYYVNSSQWQESQGQPLECEDSGSVAILPLGNARGFEARLRLQFSGWN